MLSRTLFIAASCLAALGVVEKAFNTFGRSLVSNNYNPWRFLEVATWLVLFVIALQLREIKHELEQHRSG